MTVEIDPEFRQIVIDGVGYTWELFEFLAHAPLPTKFVRIVRRELDPRVDVESPEGLAGKIVNQVLWKLEEICGFDVDEWREPLIEAIKKGME